MSMDRLDHKIDLLGNSIYSDLSKENHKQLNILGRFSHMELSMLRYMSRLGKEILLEDRLGHKTCPSFDFEGQDEDVCRNLQSKIDSGRNNKSLMDTGIHKNGRYCWKFFEYKGQGMKKCRFHWSCSMRRDRKGKCRKTHLPTERMCKGWDSCRDKCCYRTNNMRMT